jgi:predicted nucleic acid-binding Zn ribbon protein
MADDQRASAPLRGVDLARRALEEARAAAKAKGQSVGQGRSSAPRKTLRRRRGGWSGPGADYRDPQTLGDAFKALSRVRGWNPKLADGSIFGRWTQVVGADIAEHCQPVALTEGVLSVSAESTAWATNLRLMQGKMLANIAEAVGNGVVVRLNITGPTPPSWRKGDRHVAGRGPRDTYG